jgi:hypothetical protein
MRRYGATVLDGLRRWENALEESRLLLPRDPGWDSDRQANTWAKSYVESVANFSEALEGAAAVMLAGRHRVDRLPLLEQFLTETERLVAEALDSHGAATGLLKRERTIFSTW